MGMLSTAPILWTNPRNIPLAIGKSLLYFIGITDQNGKQYRYIGQTKQGARGLGEYQKDLKKISLGKPRKNTAGKGTYKAIHLALAKAYEHDWTIEFYPLENVGENLIANLEKKRIQELQSNLNITARWSVEDYAQLSIDDLISQA